MEDVKLRNLFSSFEPELTSDIEFMEKIQRNLDTVELIRRQTVSERSKNKKAVMIAASVGFIVGVLFSLLVPYLSHEVTNWRLTLPGESFLNMLVDNFTLIVWLVIGATSVLTALNTYELTLSLQQTKSPSQS